ncbi:nuclear pore complex protein Nup53 [Klebsormidium nitens]|uniref:Nuclear pore complex protein Nup53 n=1 Tax=Klebsormidium nitens TaxID=105231 RepID=A0A1Y1IBF6_KLENI|nr:nuclear pore complex protein Nup53 [Klebsormidium nitens]|eukprot:GAQ86057.1 nuclear pore complex protein Nup53 [Klebsormidium nitens]
MHGERGVYLVGKHLEGVGLGQRQRQQPRKDQLPTQTPEARAAPPLALSPSSYMTLQPPVLSLGGSTTPVPHQGGEAPTYGADPILVLPRPPHPPIETLGDFIDRTPEAATPPPQQAFSPGVYGSPPGGGMYGSPPTMGGFAPQGGFAQQASGLWSASGNQSWPPAPPQDQWQHPPQSSGGVPAAANQTPWRMLSFGGGAASPERSPMADSPVSGVVQSGALLTVPQSRPMEGMPQAGRSSEDDRWVTVYGFGPDDTNLVLREFERCGPVVEHVFGPRGSNWMHLQYQNMYDARKALAKNSAQLTGSLIIGVKPLDPQLRASITRKAEDSQTGQQTGVASPLSKTVFGPGPKTPAPAYRPYHLETVDGAKPTGIAQPSKSTMTKVLDFLFSA